MSWKDSPDIMAVRAYCNTMNRQAAVVLSFSPGGWHVTTYGASGALCNCASHIGGQIAASLRDQVLDVGQIGDLMDYERPAVLRRPRT